MPGSVMHVQPGSTRGQERPTREQLQAMGMTPAQADHEIVRRNELEVIEQTFTRWVMIFGCIICLLLPVSLGLFFYLIYSFSSEQHKACDVPLETWFYVCIINIFYHINFGGRSIHMQVIRTVCRYQASEHNLEPPPPRVRAYHLTTTVFVFMWHCVGLHWIRTSRTCYKTAPNFYIACYLFATFNVIFTLFTTVSKCGLQRLLGALLRRGILPSAMLSQSLNAAPEGTLDLQQSVIFDPEEFGDALQCPTCLEDFSKESDIKKTVCGHYFDAACLEQWLKLNRTCPLCRADLAQGLEGACIAQEEVTASEPDTIGNTSIVPTESAEAVGTAASAGGAADSGQSPSAAHLDVNPSESNLQPESVAVVQADTRARREKT